MPDVPERRWCGCEDEPNEVILAKMQNRKASLHNRGLLDNLQNALPSGTKYIGFVYRVLYRTEEERISLERIRAQHEMIHAMFNRLNDDRLHVPESGVYGFRGVQGNAQLVHMPISSSDITEESSYVEYIQVPESQSFDSFSPLYTVLSYMGSRSDLDTIVDGKMNLFIAPIESNILGQAETEQNYCVVHYKAIGGVSSPGTLSNYELGRTAVHEIGHCYGLPHIFNEDDGCGVQVFADIPAQKIPNYDGQLPADGGAPSHCNRYRDCKIYKDGDNSFQLPGESLPYSCIPCDSKGAECTECDSTLHEQFMNVMGYSPDRSLVMFSALQTEAMREFLEETDVIDLLDRPPEADSANLDDLTVPDDLPSGTESMNGTNGMLIPWWALGVMIGVVVVLIALAVWWARS